MRPDLPWNVAGIPSEAREAARAAARREGLSIGEWLTRRILAGLSDMSEAPRTDWNGRVEYRTESPYRAEDRVAARRESEEMLDRVTRSETETTEVYRRIEEQLRGMGRRLDASERSQSESNRVMSKAAVEMNIAAREQSQAFEQLGAHVAGLSERLTHVERHDSGDGLRDAVKALHQGLSRLADQISQTANQSATQISALAGNLENVAGRVGQARNEAQTATQALESRLAEFDDRVRTLEKSAQINAGSLERALESLQTRNAVVKDASAEAIARLEESIRRLEARGTDPQLDRRIAGIERTLSDVVARFEPEQDEKPASVEDSLEKIVQRLDNLEAVQQDLTRELRKVVADKLTQRAEEPPPLPPQPAPAPVFAAQAGPYSPLPVFDAPPFPETQLAAPPLSNAPPPFTGTQPPFATAQAPFASAPPPFADPSFVPPPAYDMATGYGNEQQFSPAGAEILAPPPPPPTVDSYLSAARRSARAAAEAEAERGGTFGGFAWNSGPSVAKAETREKARTRPLLVGIVALIAIAVIAGVVLSRRTSNEMASNSAVGALFEKKQPPPELKPAPAETPVVPQQSSAPPAATTTPVPGSPVLPAPQAMAPAPKQAVATPPARPAVTTPPQRLPAQATAVPPRPAKQQAAPQQQAAVQPAPVRTPPPATALDRLTSAANAGNAKAELIVGLRYLDGDGVPVNEKEAAKWLDRAATAGEPVAQYRLGTLYERGRGLAPDPAKAVRWYLAAANQGNRKAMHNLAVAYAEGTGTKKDFAEASRWFSRAANLGLSDSQFNLAVLYERGLGVPQNLVDAYKWYAIAAAQGDTESKLRINAIATQLSADDRAAAQHAADTFKPAPLDARANVAPLMADVTHG